LLAAASSEAEAGDKNRAVVPRGPVIGRAGVASVVGSCLASLCSASCASLPSNAAAPPPAAAARLIAETHKYCGDRIDSVDGFRCNDELTAAQQARRDSAWDFVYDGARLIRIDHLNGRRFLINDDRRCASWEPFWQGAELKNATCRDRNGTLRAKIHYAYAQNGTNLRWTDYLERPVAEPGGHVVGYRRRFDDQGRMIGWIAIDESGNPSRFSQAGVAEVRLKRNPNGVPVERSFYDERGQPTHDREGVHRFVYEVDPAGRTLARRWFDEQGKAVADRSGVHLLRNAHDEAGNVIGTQWYGPDGRPVRMAEEGAAAVSIVRDEHGAEIERRYFDETGKLTLSAYHYAIRRIGVDARGLRVEWTHFDVDGAPIRRIEGNFRLKAQRDARGNIIVEEFFGTDGEPIVMTFGAARVVTQYNSRDNVARVTFSLPDGAPVETVAGYATVEHQYDGDRLVLTHFADSKGRLTNSGDGFAQIHILYNPAGTERNRELSTAWPKPPSHPWRNTDDLPQLNLEPKTKGEKLNLPVSVKLVDETLAAPDILGASRLLAAAMSAYGLARVEDAAFLCYAAILRMNVDLARFVPKDRGSDSPAVYHRSLVRVMESVITPAISTRPDVLARVLERIRTLRPRSDESYRPEWDIIEELAQTKWHKSSELSRARVVRGLEILLGLLRDRLYLACSRVAWQKHMNPNARISAGRFERAIEIVDRMRAQQPPSADALARQTGCQDDDLDPNWLPTLAYQPVLTMRWSLLGSDNP